MAIALIAVLGAGLIYKGSEVRGVRVSQYSCMTNHKSMGLAAMQYTRDFDEQTPPAENWTAALSIYSRSPSIFQCTEREGLPQGVAMHSRAGLTLTQSWESAQTTIWFFDSNSPSVNASDTGSSLPSPPRHPRGNTVLFADGHVGILPHPDLNAGYGPAFEKRRVRDIQRRKKESTELQAFLRRRAAAWKRGQ